MRRVARIILGGVYVVLLGEAFVRIFAPEPIFPRYVQAADYGIRMNVPGAHYKSFTPDDTTEYRINRAGFRADVEYDVKKPDGGCRVLMLGDSFMVGYEVNVEHTIPYLVERALADAGLNCEVINMGVSGFGTAEMLVELERIGFQYSPDAVVFEWHFTDFDDNVRSGLYRLNGDTLEIGATEYLPAVEIRRKLMALPLYPLVIQYSQLYSAVREMASIRAKSILVELSAAREPQATAVAAAAGTGGTAPSRPPYPVRLAAKLLHEAERVSEAHGARFYVLDIPRKQPGGVAAVSSLPQFSEFGLLDDLAVVDLDRSLNREVAECRKVYYEGGAGHFNQRGYSIAAARLADALIAGLRDRVRQSKWEAVPLREEREREGAPNAAASGATLAARAAGPCRMDNVVSRVAPPKSAEQAL